MNPDDSVAERIAEKIASYADDWFGRHAFEEAQAAERAEWNLAASVEGYGVQPGAQFEEWQISYLEQYFEADSHGRPRFKSAGIFYPRKNGQGSRLRDFLRTLGYLVPDPPDSDRTAEPAPETPRERALRLRHVRNTGPTHMQRSPRRIDPRGRHR